MSSFRGLRLAGLAIGLALIAATSQPSAVRAAFERLLRFVELGGEPVLASVPIISDHEIEELRLASPQEQAERLLERAINGYRGAPTALLAPLEYTALIGGAIAGYLIWGEVPDRWVVIGALIIVFSGLYVVYRELQVELEPQPP